MCSFSVDRRRIWWWTVWETQCVKRKDCPQCVHWSRDARKDGDGQAVDCKWLSGKEEKRDKIQWEAASSCLNTVSWWKWRWKVRMCSNSQIGDCYRYFWLLPLPPIIIAFLCSVHTSQNFSMCDQMGSKSWRLTHVLDNGSYFEITLTCKYMLERIRD